MLILYLCGILLYIQDVRRYTIENIVLKNIQKNYLKKLK